MRLVLFEEVFDSASVALNSRRKALKLILFEEVLDCVSVELLRA